MEDSRTINHINATNRRVSTKLPVCTSTAANYSVSETTVPKQAGTGGGGVGTHLGTLNENMRNSRHTRMQFHIYRKRTDGSM